MSSVEFGKRAAELLKEVAFCSPDALPPFNDSQVEAVKDEIITHDRLMQEIFRNIINAATIPGESENSGDGRMQPNQVVWEHHTEQASAVVVHHSSILRNKRLLLNYMNERLKRIKALRWQQRTIPKGLEGNLSPAEIEFFKGYDKLLNNYMRKDSGIGLDLTQCEVPPKEPSMQVRVIQDYGEVMFSTGPTLLKQGTVHCLPRAEAYVLVREGIFVEATGATGETINIPELR
eukprot:jgi/Botrbrau1/23563/Bobra.0141s0031.1